ncbi:MAG: histidine phosphatase family protein [Candidatus Binatales bacterium]
MSHASSQTLVMVRHGETEGQSSIRYYGRTDLALSDLGRAQMVAARDALQRRQGAPDLTKSIPKVFASPLRRALEGARLIAGEDAPIVTIDEFIEVDFGLFEGLTADEIRARYPDEFGRWNRDRLAPDYAYPGGESRSAFTARVGRGVDRMLELWESTAQNESALLVAHRGVIRTIARRLASAEPVIDLGSITILSRRDSWQADILDAVDHLAGLPSHE